MKILVVGSGGREHALAWKLKQSPRVSQIYCAPGNAGTALLGENVPIPAGDIPALVEFAKGTGIDLTVVGPDDSLAAGIADAFQEANLRIFGPTASAARLESSKTFAKDFMRRHGIPTAKAREFDDSVEAKEWCRMQKFPLVVKADGLALGKGVVIAQDYAQAEEAIRRSMEDRVFGDAGSKVVIEECLTGPECSIHALVDDSGYVLFPDCRDHKRAFDNDAGPNTGGMGTISPCGSIDDALAETIRTQILDRFVAGLKKDQLKFNGMLFPGLMLTPDGPKVLEFNCRFGDPETQVLMRRLKSDLLDLLEATVADKLDTVKAEWDDRAAVCVILASGGYPESYPKGLPISGLDDAGNLPDAVVFHAGTKAQDGQVVTNGGRVLGVTALGADLAEARKAAYGATDAIHFDQMHRRNDIGGR